MSARPSTSRSRPLLSFEMQPPFTSTIYSPTLDEDTPSKRWYHYLPLAGTVFFILAPQPSLLIVLVNYHLRTRDQPVVFGVHLAVTYTLTFLIITSLIVCVVRDPGPVQITPSDHGRVTDEVDLTEALMPPDFDFSAPGKWCRQCWAPKPDRTHHCTHCSRCVLKMDHHCPWVGAKCIGHRTYPAFLHFLFCITLLATYIAIVCIFALVYAFNNPYVVDETTPIHELLLAFAGLVFSLVIGSFFFYHVYLVTTNQTTLENLSPFLLLRHLPPLPRTGHSLSDPPLEPELSYPQRRLVKDAHGYIRLYDVGWKQNWIQVIGWNHTYGWVARILSGGAIKGDGCTFPRNPKSEELLARLAVELVKADKDN
ncbi:DHHC palmitoyltransferase-domain-containing protein [Desarmillaria ectypa]|nr:DHHC palmitoyltransferase-domain-containing protein [Desarmillaria ectypa]